VSKGRDKTMDPTSSIPRSPTFENLYDLSQSREDESFFITQEEQAVIIQQMMETGKGKQGEEPK